MKKIFFSLVITLLITSCGGGFNVIKNVSDSNPDIINYSSPRIQVRGEFQLQTFYTELQFFCFQEKNSRTFSIAASYVSNQWPFFEKIIFNIDGVPHEFLPDRPPTRDVYNIQGPTETITIIIPEDILQDIYESMDTRMTVKGMDFQYDVYWKNDMKMKLFEFHQATL